MIKKHRGLLVAVAFPAKENNLIRDKSYSFALQIIAACKLLEQKRDYVIANQLLRSGTSIGANVEEAIGGQSEKDFYAKLNISYKEARECNYWLRLSRDSGILEKDKADHLIGMLKLQISNIAIYLQIQPTINRMFIVVYKEGGQIDHPLTLESYYEANKLPGEKYIFEWSRGKYTPYEDSGVWCYENGQKGHFAHGDYYLTDIVYKAKNIVDFVFRYKAIEDITIRYNFTGNSFAQGLSYAVKEILLGSKFNSWNEYQKNKANIKDMEKLKAENLALKKENEELKEKLASLTSNA